MKVCMGVEVQLHSFLIWTLGGGVWLTIHLGRFNPQETKEISLKKESVFAHDLCRIFWRRKKSLCLWHSYLARHICPEEISQPKLCNYIFFRCVFYSHYFFFKPSVAQLKCCYRLWMPHCTVFFICIIMSLLHVSRFTLNMQCPQNIVCESCWQVLTL